MAARTLQRASQRGQRSSSMLRRLPKIGVGEVGGFDPTRRTLLPGHLVRGFLDLGNGIEHVAGQVVDEQFRRDSVLEREL